MQFFKRITHSTSLIIRRKRLKPLTLLWSTSIRRSFSTTPTLTSSLRESLDSLNKKIDGELILPIPEHAHKYDAGRTQWNIEFNDYRPLSIMMAETAEDISHGLKDIILKDPLNPLPFRVRSAVLGGHLWSGYSVANNAFIFDLSRFNTIEKIKDKDSKNDNEVFKIGVGASQGHVNRILEPYSRLTLTSGDCPQFSFGGFIQGGGLSLFLRSYGIAADYLVGADVVLTNGNIVHATMDNEYSDLLYGIKGGGAGNMGIITHYYLQSIPVPNKVLSFEVYWDLPNNSQQIAQFLKAWADTQSDDNEQEMTSWLVVLHNGSNYIIRMLGIWNGDIEKGYKEWNKFTKTNGLKHNEETSDIKVTTAYNAVEIHQSTFKGDEFRGIIDARTVKNEWSDELLNKIGDTMLNYHNKNDNLGYIWLFVRYGGAMRLNDINNERTAFGNRDANGDVTVLITYDDDEKLRDDALNKMKSIETGLLDGISEYYYPNHPRSYDIPDKPVSIAYYDSDNKPWLFEKLQNIKTKYDPNNLLNNPVTIEPNSVKVSDDSGCQN